jgi:hypothetical protein
VAGAAQGTMAEIVFVIAKKIVFAYQPCTKKQSLETYVKCASGDYFFKHLF